MTELSKPGSAPSAQDDRIERTFSNDGTIHLSIPVSAMSLQDLRGVRFAADQAISRRVADDNEDDARLAAMSEDELSVELAKLGGHDCLAPTDAGSRA